MKTLRILPLLLAFAMPMHAQTFSIDWSTIDGGGTSTGGVFTVSGTIGQPDAGRMSGGQFTVEGGFWGIVAAIQTPGAPLLSITLNSQLSTITVSWPLPADGWVLQENPNLNMTNWVNVPQTPQEVGGRKQVVIPSPTGNRFYRLSK